MKYNLKLKDMKTYISTELRMSTEAKSKKEASKKLGTPAYKLVISSVNIDYLPHSYICVY